MSDSNIYILLYTSFWALSLLYYWKKKKTIDSGNFIMITYLSYGVLSFFLYNHEYSHFDELTLFPFIYLFVMMFVALYPVLRYEETCRIHPPSPSLVKRIIYLYIILSFLIIPVVLSNIVEGFFIIMMNPSGGDDLYNSSRMDLPSNGGRSLFTYIKFGYNVLSDIGVFIFFYYLTLSKKSNFVIIGLLLAILVSLLESIAYGLRTSMTMKILQLIAGYFLFKNKFSSNTKRVASIVGLSLVSLVTLLIVVINSSRFSGQNYDSNYQLLYYAGHANIYFNEYGLDAGGTRNGDRTFNSFKKWLFFDDVPKDLEDVRVKYRHMKLNDEVFSTYIGDFTLDFGPVITAIIICSFSLISTLLTRQRNNTILFHQLIIVFFVMTVCVQGGMYLFNFSFKNNIKIVSFVFFYFLFKLDYNLHREIKST